MKVPMMSAVRFDGSVVRVEEMRRVRPAAGQVLLRVAAVAIDRTDAEPCTGPHPIQLDRAGGRTLGRHAVGSVAALGVGVDGWPLGRSVVVQPEAVARRGWFTPGVAHDGALAEYLVAPADSLVPLPGDWSPLTAVQLPLAARAGSMLAHAGMSPGEAVGIWGAGALGSALVAVARALGAAPIVVIDPRDAARSAAHDLGADACLKPVEADLTARLQQLTGGGLDVAVHAAPDPTAAEQARAALGPQGRCVLVGPAESIGGIARWDGRTLSGAPRVAPAVLPQLVHLADQGRLVLPQRPMLQGGLATAAEQLNAALRESSIVEPSVLCL